MIDDLLGSLPHQPAGFGACPRCPYREAGTAEICYACARQTMAALGTDRCEVCDHPTAAGQRRCANPVCSWPDRAFGWNRSVAIRTGVLEGVINRYKYAGGIQWAMIFGRVLAGFLAEHRDMVRRFDLLIPSPTYTGPGGRPFDHTRKVLDEAKAQLPDLPVPTDPVLTKTRPTRSLVQCSTWRERHTVCREQIGPALRVNASAVAGRRILLYDDVFTDGLLLNTIAQFLRRHGTAEVCQVTLARQPFSR